MNDEERVVCKRYQQAFMRDEVYSLTLQATVQRGKVYIPRIPEGARMPFQVTHKKKLEQIAACYESGRVSEETHIGNVVRLSDELTKQHQNVLWGGRFRIGSAQKSLNLYLKYLWCLGIIGVPPHCPFDQRIISRITGYRGPTWTSIDSETEYRSLVNAAKAKARGVPLALWELQAYNAARPRLVAKLDESSEALP